MSKDTGAPGKPWVFGALGLSGLCLLGLVAALLMVEGSGGNSPAEPADSAGLELHRLRRGNRILGMEVELAKAEQPYLVLDLGARRITLKSHGVTLRDFAVLDASLQTRRLLGARGGVSAALDTVWGAGKLLPRVRRERVEILADTVTPPDLSGAVAYIPPTPEEAVPTPPSFRIRYAGDRSLLVRAANDVSDVVEGEGGTPAGSVGGGVGEEEGVGRERSPPWRFLHWLRMGPWLRDRLRVEVTLSPAQAGALYRAYGDGTALMVLGPDPFSLERK